MRNDTPIYAPPTARQMQIYEFMLAYQAQNGAPPTLREIAAHIGASSTNAATEHVRYLARRGMVKHYPGRGRGWVPIKKEI